MLCLDATVWHIRVCRTWVPYFSGALLDGVSCLSIWCSVSVLLVLGISVFWVRHACATVVLCFSARTQLGQVEEQKLLFVFAPRCLLRLSSILL